MLRMFLIVDALIALGAVFVLYVAPAFMPAASEVVTPDTSVIEYARDVIEGATGAPEPVPSPVEVPQHKVTGVVVNMSGKGLTSVPKEVFSLRDTTTLDLSHNALSGSLPAEVRHLANLEVLDLSHNTFTGVPAEVGQLVRLRVLNLASNPITGLPHEIGNLKNLERLELSGTNYSKQDLKVIMEGLPPDVLIVVD